ncbi:MAG: Trk system potassium transporter TrkA [Kiritimatiellia bacterium]|jgi:trk system potassium uptake protein TrkA
MKIIIIGAGNAGRLLAKRLSSEERFSVVLIDPSEEALALAQDALDVMTVCGSGADPDVLAEAEAEKADIVVAVTDSDETNILACLFAHAAGVPRKIARVANHQYQRVSPHYDLGKMGIDLVINPKTACAEEICRALALPGSIESFDLFGGKATVAGFKVGPDSPAVGLTPATLPDRDLLDRIRLIAIRRGDSLIIPRGDTAIARDDAVYLVGEPDDIRAFSVWMNPGLTPFVKVVVGGGGDIGLAVARTLETWGVDVVLMERDKERALHCAGELKRAVVLNTDALGATALDDAGIVERTAFIGVTGDDENNVMNCLMARKRGVDFTITQISRTDYIPAIEALGVVDRIISPFESLVHGIMHHLRRRNVRAAAIVHNMPGELLDIQVSEHNRHLGVPFKEIRFPRESIVAVVLRDGGVIPATGDMTLNANDRMLVFSHRSAVRKLQDMFRR